MVNFVIKYIHLNGTYEVTWMLAGLKAFNKMYIWELLSESTRPWASVEDFSIISRNVGGKRLAKVLRLCLYKFLWIGSRNPIHKARAKHIHKAIKNTHHTFHLEANGSNIGVGLPSYLHEAQRSPEVNLRNLQVDHFISEEEYPFRLWHIENSSCLSYICIAECALSLWA